MLLTIKFTEKEQELIKVIFSNSSTSRASNILNKQIELSTSLITSASSEMLSLSSIHVRLEKLKDMKCE